MPTLMAFNRRGTTSLASIISAPRAQFTFSTHGIAEARIHKPDAAKLTRS